MNQDIFCMGDGDDVRNKIELLLFSGELKALKEFSERLSEAISNIEKLSKSKLDATIILSGGDDIIFSIKKNTYAKSEFENLSSLFFSMTGTTISFGIGNTIELAYLNLRRAKISGKGKIVDIGIL